MSVSISTKLTGAAAAFKACTMARLAEVGNSQSLSNDTTQMRVLQPLNAFASEPSPYTAAKSK